MSDRGEGLLHLGSQGTVYNDHDPDSVTLDRIPNLHQDSLYYARFTVPEFTSLCPKTRQPDFATIVIDYMPKAWLVESKALKLYMFAFRNHGAFHEDCTVAIGKRLWQALDPHWMRVAGLFNARGGIPIDVFWTRGEDPTLGQQPPPYLDVRSYRAR